MFVWIGLIFSVTNPSQWLRTPLEFNDFQFKWFFEFSIKNL